MFSTKVIKHISQDRSSQIPKEKMHENPWDPIPGELPIRTHPDYDLGVPFTFFEYEMDSRIH